MRRAEMLGVEIGFVGVARAPVDKELELGGAVFDPMETHVDGLRALLFDGVIGKTARSGVVNLHGGAWLRVAHFFQGGADGNGLLAVDVGGSDFGFSSGAHDIAKNFADSVEWSVGGWRLGRWYGWVWEK